MKRQVSFEKLGGWTSGVVRRSRPIVHTRAYRLARTAASHLGLAERVLAEKVFPDSAPVKAMKGLVG
jgi:uncharacterized protein (DUF1501 family)